MMQYLIIDGYNIINKWPDLIRAKQKSMELAREKLNTIIQKYTDFKEIKVTIVYDGAGQERSRIEGNPEIIFSKNYESADAIIESLVYNYDNPEQILVATDDNNQRNFIIGAGAYYVSAEGLMSEVNETLADMRKALEKDHPYA